MCKWYDSNGNYTEYSVVRMFYKQLKKINSTKAEEFRNLTEDREGITVPYQELREYAKNHDKTKELINKI